MSILLSKPPAAPGAENCDRWGSWIKGRLVAHARLDNSPGRIGLDREEYTLEENLHEVLSGGLACRDLLPF